MARPPGKRNSTISQLSGGEKALTAVALVPLTFWFIFSIIRLQGATQEDIVDWLSRPRRLVFMCSLIVCTFYHLMLGLQIVIEDYIHNPAGKMAANLANKAGCGAMCIYPPATTIPEQRVFIPTGACSLRTRASAPMSTRCSDS